MDEKEGGGNRGHQHGEVWFRALPAQAAVITSDTLGKGRSEVGWAEGQRGGGAERRSISPLSMQIIDVSHCS